MYNYEVMTLSQVQRNEIREVAEFLSLEQVDLFDHLEWTHKFAALISAEKEAVREKIRAEKIIAEEERRNFGINDIVNIDLDDLDDIVEEYGEVDMSVVEKYKIHEYGTRYKEEGELLKSNGSIYLFDKELNKFVNTNSKKFRMRVKDIVNGNSGLNVVKSGAYKSGIKYKKTKIDQHFVKTFKRKNTEIKGMSLNSRKVTPTYTLHYDRVGSKGNTLKGLIQYVYNEIIKLYKGRGDYSVKKLLETYFAGAMPASNLSDYQIKFARPGLRYIKLGSQVDGSFTSDFSDVVVLDLSNELAVTISKEHNNNNRGEMLNYYVGKINTKSQRLLKEKIEKGGKQIKTTDSFLNNKVIKKIEEYGVNDLTILKPSNKGVMYTHGSDALFNTRDESHMNLMPITDSFQITFTIKRIEREITANGEIKEVGLILRKWYVTNEYECNEGDCLPAIFFDKTEDIENFKKKNGFDLKKYHDKQIKQLKKEKTYDIKTDYLKLLSKDTGINIVIFDEDTVPLTSDGAVNIESVLRIIKNGKVLTDDNEGFLTTREDLINSKNNEKSNVVYILHCRKNRNTRMKNHYSMINDFHVNYDEDGDLRIFKGELDNGSFIYDVKLKLKKMKTLDPVKKFKSKEFTYINYDIEAVIDDKGESYPYSISYVILKSEEIKEEIITKSNEKKMIEIFKERCKYYDIKNVEDPISTFLDDIMSIDGSILLTGYNSMRYDNIFLYGKCIEKGLKINPFFANGSLFDLKIEEKQDIKCFDVCRFVNNTLKQACEDFDTYPRKMEGFSHKIPQEIYNNNGLKGLKKWIEENRTIIENYNKIDVLACTSLFIKVRNGFLMKMKRDIISNYTLPSYADSFLRSKMTDYNKKIDTFNKGVEDRDKKRKMYINPAPNVELDIMIRKSAIAGRCSKYTNNYRDSYHNLKINNPKRYENSLKYGWEDFIEKNKLIGEFTGDSRKIFIDIKSEYPYVMKNRYFPHGDIELVREFSLYRLGIYKVRIHDQGPLPIIPLRDKDSGELKWEYIFNYISQDPKTKEIKQHYNYNECYLTSQDIFKLKQEGITYDLLPIFDDNKYNIVGIVFTGYNNIYYGDNLNEIITEKTKQDIYKSTSKIENVDSRLEKRKELVNNLYDKKMKEKLLEIIEQEKNENYNKSLRELSKLFLNSLSGKPMQRNYCEGYKMMYSEDIKEEDEDKESEKIYRKVDVIDTLLQSDTEKLENMDIKDLKEIYKQPYSIFSPEGNTVVCEYNDSDCILVKTCKPENEAYDCKISKPSQIGCFIYSHARTYLYSTALTCTEDSDEMSFYSDTDSSLISYGTYKKLLNKHVFIKKIGPHVDYRVENIEFKEDGWEYSHKYFGGEFGQYEPELLHLAERPDSVCRMAVREKKNYYIQYVEANGDVIVDNNYITNPDGSNILSRLGIKLAFKGVNLNRDRLIDHQQAIIINRVKNNEYYENIEELNSDINMSFDIDYKVKKLNDDSEFRKLIFEISKKLDSDFNEMIEDILKKIKNYEDRYSTDKNAKSNFKFDYFYDNIFNPDRLRKKDSDPYTNKIYFLHSGLAKSKLCVRASDLVKCIILDPTNY